MSKVKYILRLARQDECKDATFAIDAKCGAIAAGGVVFATEAEIHENLQEYCPDDCEFWEDLVGVEVAWLERLHVVPEYRRQGIALTLVHKALQRLRRKKFIGCFVTVHPLDSTITQNQLECFYREFGFKYDGTDMAGRRVFFIPLGE